MRKFQGFTKAGLAAAIVVAVAIAVAAFLVIDGNNKATNYNDYDWYSVIDGDSHNGEISDHVKDYASSDNHKAEDAYDGEPVLIFEYADFQCPGCAAMNKYVNQAVEELKGKLVVVYRNYLLSYHQNATAAASAAEAAGLQKDADGKSYWKKYADKLFKEQSEWEYASANERAELFSQYFEDVTDGKGDLEQFKTDMESKAVSDKISFDMGLGKRVGVESTPGFFVDGQMLDWSSKTGSEITINGKTFSWDSALTAEGFVQMLKDITYAKLEEKTSGESR